MYPLDVNADRRVKYAEHMGRYEFSSLSFFVPLQAVGPFSLRNKMSNYLYGMDDDNKVIYPIRVLSTLVPEYTISKSEWKLPVAMHNLKGYDGLMIVKALNSEFGEVRVIPQNITVDRIKFIDSLQFTHQSVDSMVKTLQVDEFKYVREAFPIQHEFELIKRKGVYPYDYMDSCARFDESRLPSQDAFFSKLSASPCSDVEYARAT